MFYYVFTYVVIVCYLLFICLFFFFLYSLVCVAIVVDFVYLFVLFCFFFFKQKTAYEMRISDWSSDVCSSDLFFAGETAACCRCSCDSLPHKGQVGDAARGRDRLDGVVPFERLQAFPDPNSAAQHDRHLDQVHVVDERSEERRGGKEGVSTCRSRWSPYT